MMLLVGERLLVHANCVVVMLIGGCEEQML